MRVGLSALVCDDEGCYDDGSDGTGSTTLNPFGNSTGLGPGTDTIAQSLPVISPLVIPTAGIIPNGGGVILNNTTNGSLTAAQVAAMLAPLSNIASARFAVPQLNPGQSITVLPNGGYQVTQNANGVATGASLSAGLTSLFSGSSMPLLLIGGLALFMMSSGGGGRR